MQIHHHPDDLVVSVRVHLQPANHPSMVSGCVSVMKNVRTESGQYYKKDTTAEEL